MPAQGAYFHIYNQGVEKRIIFDAEEDYEVFLGYLKEYLTTPPHPEKAKKTFTVKGRVYKGVPHLPKNYFKEVELIAYSLMPDHFHLLIREVSPNSLQNFMRSLCTRYSMYFNKKYARTGSLFQGPYKSIKISNTSSLLYLTHYFHREHGHSSYEEFLGTRKNSWVKPEVVLSLFERLKNDTFKETRNYKDFIEKYELNQKEEKLLEEVIIEKKQEHPISPTFAPATTEITLPLNRNRHSKSRQFLALSIGVFIILFSLGLRNIKVSEAQIKNSLIFLPSPTPQVSGAEDTNEVTAILLPTPVKSQKLVVIKIEDKSEYVNLRAAPSTRSQKIGEAHEGESFELVSKENGWYQIKLNDGSEAFVSERYATEKEE